MSRARHLNVHREHEGIRTVRTGLLFCCCFMTRKTRRGAARGEKNMKEREEGWFDDLSVVCSVDSVRSVDVSFVASVLSITRV